MFSFPGLLTVSVAIRASPRCSMVTPISAIPAGSGTLDQLDLVAVGILDERDHRGAEFYGSGWPSDLDAFLAEPFARGINVRHADRQMPEAATDVVRVLLIPIVRELDDGVAGFIA